MGVCGWVCGTLVFEILMNTNEILMNGYCRQSFFNSHNGYNWFGKSILSCTRNRLVSIESSYAAISLSCVN